MTASCLSRTSTRLPSDLYFYASGREVGSLPDFTAQHVGFREHPSILLDAIMGSGSIFPVCPLRPLEDFPRPGERIELVDGGFSHNSPVEAAVRCGALLVSS